MAGDAKVRVGGTGSELGRRHGGRAVAALAVACLTFALIPLGVLPILFAVPVIGLVLAWGAPGDNRPLVWGPRNAVMGLAVVFAGAVVVLQPQLQALLISAFGIDQSALVVTLNAVTAMGLPLAMADSRRRQDGGATSGPVVSRRSLMLAMTVLITVATWYGSAGQSFLPLACLVVLLPVLLAATRVLAARRARVVSLWPRSARSATSAHRWQFLNILLLCALLGAAMLPGTYDVLRLDWTSTGYRVFQIAYVAGLVGFVLLATIPLRRIHLASNLLVLTGSVFIAAQLVVIYRPANDPVSIATPLADPWYVAHGGRAELINYHHVTSTQRDALDIVRVVDGSTHRSGATGLRSYYILGAGLLAPADGTVTAVVDGHPDQRVGSVDNEHQAGNHIVIDIGGGRYLEFSHLRQNSISVRVGDTVRSGQPIAEVGNSGNTDQPHLHIQALNQPSFPDAIHDIKDPGELLRTVRTYPLIFRDVILTRHGNRSMPAAADLRRGDLIAPLP